MTKTRGIKNGTKEISPQIEEWELQSNEVLLYPKHFKDAYFKTQILWNPLCWSDKISTDLCTIPVTTPLVRILWLHSHKRTLSDDFKTNKKLAQPVGSSLLCSFLQLHSIFADSIVVTYSACKNQHTSALLIFPRFSFKRSAATEVSPYTCQRSTWKEWSLTLSWDPAVAHSEVIKGKWTTMNNCWLGVTLLVIPVPRLLKLQLTQSFSVVMERETPISC